MSKKDRLNKKEKNEPKVEKPQAEPKTKTEKIFSAIAISIGVIVTLTIILVAILSGGEKVKIAKRYQYLTKDNVFEYIDYSTFKSKIDNGDEFQVLFINQDLKDADYYIYFVDTIIKDFEADHEQKYQPIYIFETTSLSKDQESYLKKNIDNNILAVPNLVYYKKTIHTYSVDYDSTCRYDISRYNGNYWNLLTKYFANCFPKPVLVEE